MKKPLTTDKSTYPFLNHPNHGDVNMSTIDESLSQHIEQSIRQYFKDLGSTTPNNLYELMVYQLEKPLLKVVLEHTRGNQTRTARILGLNRGTLRKKLQIHNMM